MQIGAIVIQGENVLLIVSLLMTYVFFYYGLFVLKAERNVMDVIFNSFVYGLVIWKLSYGIVHPNVVLQNPLTLLYFNGGMVGLVLAVIFIVLYTYWQLKKQHISFDVYIRSVTPLYFGYWIVFIVVKGIEFSEHRFIWLQAAVALIFFHCLFSYKNDAKDRAIACFFPYFRLYILTNIGHDKRSHVGAIEYKRWN